MVKPILRLGPGHEPDDDYDPLLGRTVREDPVMSPPPLTRALDPDRSVFDEPELDPVIEPVMQDAPVIPDTTRDAPVTPAQPSLLDWMEKWSTPAANPGSAEPAQTALSEPSEIGEPNEAHDHVVFGSAPDSDVNLNTDVPEEALAATKDHALANEDVAPDTNWHDDDADWGEESAPTTDQTVGDEPAGEPAAAPAPKPIWQSQQSDAVRTDRPGGTSATARRRANMRRSPTGRRKHIQRLMARGAGTIFLAVAVFFTLLSFAAPLGYPFDAASGYRWYWIVCSIVATLSWAGIRARGFAIVSGLVAALNLMVILPALGEAPKGGAVSSAVVSWANLRGQPDALEKVLAEAERRKANLVLVGEAPANLKGLAETKGWRLIEAPLAGDPTSIGVLTRGRWQSATVPGEPTTIRTQAGDLTILATRPPPSRGQEGVQAAREAQLNRAAVRAGDQDGPVVVLGDFGVAPWDGAMQQFQNYGNVTRVRCGGLLGNTVSQGFGLIGVAHDHAYVRDVKVTHCRLGQPLPGSRHRAIYLYLSPQEPGSPR
ncbi:hypothetical protein PbB2_02371 [Candidatus Phycosocius bacilliformis]|uniref:Endonuclease/exonuclease/phosphatase domain-containing protein n=1 Tax=Candidatus Phycosocius bacilliformis TaxID=1445552 RepID=A0A2P2ECA6_9PROT|nr:endonuclease/exonuclease/phosphatase family protein [Candidatus Phycosocius bacilliformis]GBF58683.1 hypothetical protein PbB2_02371 [Candidatus Phycosocius bacilliformis]